MFVGEHATTVLSSHLTVLFCKCMIHHDFAYAFDSVPYQRLLGTLKLYDIKD